MSGALQLPAVGPKRIGRDKIGPGLQVNDDGVEVAGVLDGRVSLSFVLRISNSYATAPDLRLRQHDVSLNN